jgi:UDP-2,3-diacylglucosamine pyrophosphatase LpxH
LFLFISHLHSIEEPISEDKLVAFVEDDSAAVEEVICVDKMDILAPALEFLVAFPLGI